MKKKALQFAIGLFIFSNGAFAQAWSGNDQNVNSYRFGNVGIGTSSPDRPLTVVSGGNSLAIFQNTSSVNTSITVANTLGSINIGIGATTPHPYLWSNTNNLFIGNDGNPTLFVQGMGNGSVGIGTSNTGSFKLAVEGKIAAREIQVTLANPFPDYVFSPNYKLRSLASLEQYINNNKHLPGVPSAEEVEEKGGVELGLLNTKLLEKVEELTLYVIELKKENEQMKKEIEKLAKGK